MINTAKITNNFSANPIAGLLPNDNAIEFMGIRETKKVLWFQNGCAHYFNELPSAEYNLLKKAYLEDEKAFIFLYKITPILFEQVELFTYYNYGALDGTPDILNGELSPSENFRDKENCPSLLWCSKKLTIGDHVLIPRQITMIDCMSKGIPDKTIADVLNIAHSTLDNHKKTLFSALNIQSKSELLQLAFLNKIIA